MPRLAALVFGVVVFLQSPAAGQTLNPPLSCFAFTVESLRTGMALPSCVSRCLYIHQHFAESDLHTCQITLFPDGGAVLVPSSWFFDSGEWSFSSAAECRAMCFCFPGCPGTAPRPCPDKPSDHGPVTTSAPSDEKISVVDAVDPLRPTTPLLRLRFPRLLLLIEQHERSEPQLTFVRMDHLGEFDDYEALFAMIGRALGGRVLPDPLSSPASLGAYFEASDGTLFRAEEATYEQDEQYVMNRALRLGIVEEGGAVTFERARVESALGRLGLTLRPQDLVAIPDRESISPRRGLP